MCSITTLALLYAARDADEFREIEADEATLRDVPVTVLVQRAAIGALRALRGKGAGYHRIKLPDALIAAAAQEAGIGVLHYDHHSDRLAEILAEVLDFGSAGSRRSAACSFTGGIESLGCSAWT